MSAICGVLWRDGRPVAAADIGRMVTSLAHWGPDAMGVWREGGVGLGNLALWSTPEAQTEPAPFRDAVNRRVITADVRLDNREDLRRVLAIDAAAAAQMGDAEFILRAYEKWGTACVEQLVGDFAFALWDGPAQRLFCARDPMGIKPFFYHLNDRALLFGSEVKAIFAHAEVPRGLNALPIAVALAGLPSCDDQTAFEAVRCLEPASAFTLDAAGMRTWRYWRLELEREIHFARDDDYVDAMEDVLQRAVNARLRSSGRVGCMLSGGLDATTCLALAMKGGAISHDRLSAFSWALAENDPWWEGDERPFIEIFRRAHPLDHHYIVTDPADLLVMPPEVLRHQNGPHARIDYGQMSLTFAAARRSGVRVLLNGTGGDETASYAGRDHLLAFALGGDWAALRDEVAVRAVKLGRPRWWALGSLLKPLMQPSRLRSPLNYQFSYRRRCDRTRDLSELGIPLSRSLAERIGLEDYVRRTLRLRRPGAWRHPMRADQIHVLTQTHVVSDQTAAWNFAAAYGIECRCPYLDRRVIEFAVAVPARQHFHAGTGRRLLRRVARRHLPEKIANRTGKSATFPGFDRGLVQAESEIRQRISMWKNNAKVSAFLDLYTLESDLDDILRKLTQSSRDWSPGLPFFRGYLLGAYLQGGDSCHGPVTA